MQKFSIISTTEEIEKKLRTNFLKCTLATTTSNGITCTNNGDGTYTLDGKATSVTYFNLGDTNLSKGKYKILGCPKNANGATIHNNSPKCNDTGDGKIIELTETKNIAPSIMVPNGSKLTDAVFKPMITENLNAIYDDFVSSNDSFITGKAIEDKALTYEEIQASTNLDGKIASAETLKYETINIQTNPDFNILYTCIKSCGFVYLSIWSDSTLSSGTELAVLPSEAKPFLNSYPNNLSFTNAYGYGQDFITIGIDGKIIYYGNQTNWKHFTCVFFSN